MEKGLKYVSCPFDSSGYGNAARQYLLGMYQNDLPIVLKGVTFEQHNRGISKVRNQEFFEHLMSNEVDYDTVLAHLTPEWYAEHYEKGKVNFSYSVWETDKLWHEWVDWLNAMDGLITASEWNKQVYISCGVTRPIEVVPHAIDFDFYNSDVTPDTEINDFRTGKEHIFYTIGQFTERKNLQGLLVAFQQAFEGRDDVGLVVKTFGTDYSSHHQGGTKNAISSYLSDLRMAGWEEKVFLITEQLTDSDIVQLHKDCDYYVSLHRGEGAGITLLEAGAVGNPIISTGWSGSTEFLNKQNSFLIDYKMTPVRNMPWIPWYTANQRWAEPNLDQAIEAMRAIVKSNTKAKKLGKVFQEEIKTKYTPILMGRKMIEAIDKLKGEI